MIRLALAAPREQGALVSEPYDRWVLPDGSVRAEFHRRGDDFLLRFLDEADFEISVRDNQVIVHPVAGFDEADCHSLFENAVTPVLGNHAGGLFLHGSAVAVGEHGIAFLGLSRSGKTTLAGAFARSGHPFLTEDVIDLEAKGGEYWIRPNSSALRLFPDSAEYLLGCGAGMDEDDEKQAFDGGAELPFSKRALPLKALFVLGDDHDAALAIERRAPGKALTSLLPHAFILDVEDRKRMRGHFDRLADLSEQVAVHTLDYPRTYSALPDVCSAIIEACS